MNSPPKRASIGTGTHWEALAGYARAVRVGGVAAASWQVINSTTLRVQLPRPAYSGAVEVARIGYIAMTRTAPR